MRKMKDSGIEWIGEIPEDWEVKPIKSLFSFGKGLPITKDNLIENGSSVISYGQIHSKNNIGVQIVDDLKRFVSETYLDTNPNSLVHKGDFIFADTSEDLEGCGNFVYVDKEEILFAGYHTIILFSKQNINNKYLAYLFKTDAWRCQIRGLCSGVKLFSISKKILGQTRIILPMVHEQQRIVDFLDRKCSEIDSVISKTRETIEEYKKLKQSIITEVVTGKVKIENEKACGKYDTYKDSGIEWIGEIPSEWEVKPIKALFSFGKGLPITKDNLTETGLSVISYGQIHSKNNIGTEIRNELIRYVDKIYYETNPQSLVHKGDFIFADTSEDLIGCGNFVYVNREEDLFAGYHTIILFSKEKNDNKYLAYLFQTDCWRRQIRCCCSGVKLFSISRRILGSTNLILPSILEQQQISDFLDQKCSEIDSLIAKKEQLVVELESYKKSLICEVVTGKKEMC